VVVSRQLLTELVPLEWATKGVVVTQFDKDDIETLGLVKMDILALRNLSAIEDSLPLIEQHHGIDLDIDNIPLDDEPTYAMLRTRGTVGCFQVESPGMRGLLGRLQPEDFDDLTAQISLFRPGPMQADMIKPFIARRHEEEPITYLHPSLEPVLKDTYGVILYQEQVLSVAHAFAGFTYGQADSLRRAMTTDRSQEEMERIREGFVSSACKRGIEADIAEEVFSKLRAFAAYGFCKAHACSFAKIAYQTAYLKTHYPAEFFTGILNNQPMGFYPANVIFEEARRLEIRLLGVDVNLSEKRFTVEYDGNRAPGIRVGLDRVKRLTSASYSDTNETADHAFDAMGNRTSDRQDQQQNYFYDNANRLTSFDGGSSTYDANGNTLSSWSQRTFQWDSQNRLRQCVWNNYTTSFTYGPDGLRRSTSFTPPSGPTTTTHYLLDGQSVIMELQDVNSNGTFFSGTPPQAEAGEVKAVYCAGQRGIEFRLDSQGNRRWYLYDGLGSVLAEVDDNGTMTYSRKGDVYGGWRMVSGLDRPTMIAPLLTLPRLGHGQECLAVGYVLPI
jgi:hypothetical protein